MYKIIKITDKEGNERTDGRYPLRKGCVVEICNLNIRHSMILAYAKDNEGNTKSGYLQTSLVDNYKEHNNRFIVYTMNSVYYLQNVDQR